MFGLITEKEHNRVVKELSEDRDATILESANREAEYLKLIDELKGHNQELGNKVNACIKASTYSLGKYQINLSFYYSQYNNFYCQVTFTPELYDSTKRFGWDSAGNEKSGEVEIIKRIFQEIGFKGWRWSTPDNKPVYIFEHHDIARIVESVKEINTAIQAQLNNVLKAEQCLRIARATESSTPD